MQEAMRDTEKGQSERQKSPGVEKETASERLKRRLSLKQRQKGREEMRTQREAETLVKGQIEKDKEK